MQSDNPASLADELKKSGEFARLRRDLLAQFQQDKSYTVLKERIEEAARKRMQEDTTLYYFQPEAVQKELLRDLDRYPFIERALAETSVLSSDDLNQAIRDAVSNIAQARKSARDSAQGGAGATPIAQDPAASDVSKDQAPRDSQVSTTAEGTGLDSSKASDPTQKPDKQSPAPMEVDATSEVEPKQANPVPAEQDVEMADEAR